MNYTLHQLRIFQEIAENGSITKAAERLHLTQPAVSIQLKKFQEQFEVPLMEVIGRKLYITPFGEEILESSRRILEEVENIEIQTKAFKGDLAGRLSFSVVSTGKYIMPYFISGFLNRNRSVRLKMDVTNKQQVIADLESNRVDFALVSIIPENLRVEHVSLMDNRLFLIGSKESDLSVYPNFSDVPFIFREKGSAPAPAGTRTASPPSAAALRTIAPRLDASARLTQTATAAPGESAFLSAQSRHRTGDGLRAQARTPR